MPPRKTVVVVGGGISGLTAAWHLATQHKDLRVTLLEAGARLGGKIRTESFGYGFVETGADSFAARDPWGVELADELGLTDELEAPAVFGARVWIDGRLAALPSNLFYGIPTRAGAIFGAPLDMTARLRALQDLVLPGPLRGEDVAVGELIRKRFGEQVLERLVDPLLAGTRAGRADEISLAAGLPQVDAAARANRSVMKGLRKQMSRGDLGEGPPPFLSLKNGLERLVERLRDRLQQIAEIRTEWTTESVQPSGSAYEVVGPERIHADAVVVTTPAFVAANLLRAIAPEANTLLDQIDYAPSINVILSLDKPPTVPAGTSGVLVPSRAGLTVAALTWWSVKWPRSQSGEFVVRCFIGRAGEIDLDLEDASLVDRCLADVRAIIGSGNVVNAAVTRWDKGMPVYKVGHLGRVEAIERELRAHPGLAVTGAALRGSGIPDCIRQARTAADNIAGYLKTH